MAKAKAKKAKRDTEKLEDDEIRTSNHRPDEEDCPSASHSKGKKKKHKKNHMDSPNGDISQKKKKKKIENEGNKQEENEACYLPGQKHDRPHERDPLRIFFEVLHQQSPNCELAASWMMEWGLLPREDAMTVYERQLKNNQAPEQTSSATALPHNKTSKVSSWKADKVSSNTVLKVKKRKVSENTSEDGSMLSKKKRKPTASAG